MKAVIAIDSFKGSLSSLRAGEAVKEAIKEVFPDADAVVLPVADGGEGTVESLVKGLSGEICRVKVTGPLGDETVSEYGMVGKVAIIEMAAAAGLPLVPAEKRNPLYTTTYGVGELILDAVRKGCRSFIIGIGGSATNDGGVGMLKALGYRFLDEKGKDIRDGAIGLKSLRKIDAGGVASELSDLEFNIACDVKNPLLGENGCSAIYGPQKGADKETVRLMDSYLENYFEVTKELFPDADESYPGSGAAGGLGFAFRTFLSGKLCPGIDLILDKIGLEKELIDADVVVTGEGRLDSQTAMGKAPSGVAKLAKHHGVPVIAFSGSVSRDADISGIPGIDALFPILRGISTLEEAMVQDNAYANMKATAKQVFLLIKSIKGL